MSAMKSKSGEKPDKDRPKKQEQKGKSPKKAGLPYSSKTKNKDWKKEAKPESFRPADTKKRYSASSNDYHQEEIPDNYFGKARKDAQSKNEGRNSRHGSASKGRKSYGTGYSGADKPARWKNDREKGESHETGFHNSREGRPAKPGKGRDEWQKRSSIGRKDYGTEAEQQGRTGDERPKRRYDKMQDQTGKSFKPGKYVSRKPADEARYPGKARRDDVKPYADKYADTGRKGAEKPKHQKGFNADGSIRLNKYIANSGVCSRREADELIISGGVTVNGIVVTRLGTRITREDKVEFGGETLDIEKKVYLLLNKPKGYITTVDDPEERKTVMMLVKGACRERIYPVGRLDRNTTGLLLLTNDGELTKKLTHPSHRVRKVYHVELDKSLAKADLERLNKGIELEDGMMAVDEIAYTGQGDDRKNIGVVIHSGRNRIVRRLFEALDYEVVKLDRVGFANLTKKDLPRGKWRMLDQNEINVLMMV
ncbi:pseudouridine synthase [Lentimicrobium sp.]